MTIDEAIEDSKECDMYQIAEWLEELKVRRVIHAQAEKEFFSGYNQALEKIKDASVIFDGEKIYGSNTKVILITEEKYNEIFNKGEEYAGSLQKLHTLPPNKRADR